MLGVWIAVALALLAAAVAVASMVNARTRAPRRAEVVELENETSVDPATEAVTSVQKADLLIDRDALHGDLDTGAPRAPRPHLLALPDARHARSDPRPLHASGSARWCCSPPPLRLLTFQAPEYEMDASHGLVRWRISRGPAGLQARPRRARLPADRGTPPARGRRRRPPARACTSRSRWPTSTRRSPRG